MPLTETGFKRRTFAEILEDKIAKCKELFGDDINTEENTPLGKFIRINAYDQSIAEEEAENIYYSIFPNTASGTSLDHLCVFAGIARNEAISSRYIVKATGVENTVIPKGFLASTESGVEFTTVQDYTIGSDGTVNMTVECTESGDIGNVNFAEINQIVNPVTDVESVVGVSLVTKGEEVESDYSLRQRFNSAKEGLGYCNEASIRAAVMRVPTVESAGIIVNETDTTDSKGLPPRSFECYVFGGENYEDEIANAIYEKKPLGIKTHGTISKTITDVSGHTHTVKFSHTTTKTVYVQLTITTSAEFETSGYAEIKANIEDYIDSLGIGKSVYLSSLYGQIHKVTGVKEVTDLKLSTNGTTYSASNIVADEDEICQCAQVKISGQDQWRGGLEC